MAEQSAKYDPRSVATFRVRRPNYLGIMIQTLNQMFRV